MLVLRHSDTVDQSHAAINSAMDWRCTGGLFMRAKKLYQKVLQISVAERVAAAVAQAMMWLVAQLVLLLQDMRPEHAECRGSGHQQNM
jgi:hypothetical protein